MSTALDPSFAQRIARIEDLISSLEQSSDPRMKANAQELVQAVLELHGAGLSRMLEQICEAESAGRPLLDALASDELVGSLLTLHGLHPLDLEARVRQALDAVRPQLRSHGGEVTLLSVHEGVVRLRLEGNCHGCPSSTVTMKHLIEEAIAARAPDVVAIDVEGVADPQAAVPAGLIPVEQLFRGQVTR